MKEYKTALYSRLSREDGDKPDSDSIINQHYFLSDFCSAHSEFSVVDYYDDDGYTGTNFNRPAFQRMLSDAKAGKVDCIIVKDLSRFGRDYIDVGYYLERLFPSIGVRFIAINDNTDSLDGPYSLMLPIKNVFNAQYAKDISDKVRTAFRAKQRRGEFVGAFASYGYLKDPENHNHLIIDPVASKVVRRVFEMAASGLGQVRIAKILNEEHIPCPSEYKRLMGERYSNSKKLEETHYWTYSTIHRMLQNQMYVGTMVQNRYVRPTMHSKAKKADESEWIIKEKTHESIISKELWDTVQVQIHSNSREIDFKGNVGLFAGFLRCGDCGRAMTKTTWNNRVTYSCGSYHRYGSMACTSHYIPQSVLSEVILGDLNKIIADISNLRELAEKSKPRPTSEMHREGAIKKLEAALFRVRKLKKSVYEDYRDDILSKEEFLSYKTDYERQEASLVKQLEQSAQQNTEADKLNAPWVEQLLRLGKISELDRATLSQTVKEIRIFEDKRIEITYLFSDELKSLLEK